MYDAIILGGGAAGLAAAIRLAEREPGFSVLVLEKRDRVGKKLAVTGNGQCNLTNTRTEADCYHGDPALALSLIGRFPYEAQKAFFARTGLMLTERSDGKVYPHSLQASAVVDALRFRAAECGITVLTDAAVETAKREADGFCVTAGQNTYRARTLLIACGGAAGGKLGGGDGYALLRAFGHRVTPLRPAIVQLKTEGSFCRSLAGIKLPARLRAAGVTAPLSDLLFCDYGLSGPGALFLSSYFEPDKPFPLTADLAPDLAPDETMDFLISKRENCPDRPLEELLSGLLPRKVGMMLLKAEGFSLSRPLSSLEDGELDAVNRAIHALPFTVTDTAGMPGAQVTAGGADTEEFDRETLMSRKVPGLFAAGEVLNVDGNCGGYNLQFAWASADAAAAGMIAWCRP